jgi:hypothetical protein
MLGAGGFRILLERLRLIAHCLNALGTGTSRGDHVEPIAGRPFPSAMAALFFGPGGMPLIHGGSYMKKTSFALVVAGLMAAGPALAQGMGGTGTAGGTQNTGPQGTGNFVSGKPGDPGAAATGRSGANTSGAGGAAGSTSSGDMGNTNNSKK